MAEKFISFDLTGTLSTYRFTERVWFEEMPRLLAERRNLDFEEARRRLIQLYDEVGEERIEWYDIKYWFRRLELGDGWREMLEKASSSVELYPETEEILLRLKERFRLVLLTNAAREFIEFEISSIRHHFENIFSCVSDFGEVKKTPEFYLKVCGILGIEPPELIHVGDHLKFDYLVPREVGIKAYYLDRSGKKTGEFMVKDLWELEERLRGR